MPRHATKAHRGARPARRSASHRYLWLGAVVAGLILVGGVMGWSREGSEPAYLEVAINPAAHGEAGLGPILRSVLLETEAGHRIQFDLKARRLSSSSAPTQPRFALKMYHLFLKTRLGVEG